MISSQPWQFIIGLSLGALLIGGLSSVQILEKSIKDDKTNQTNYRSPVGRSSFSNMFSSTNAARPYGQTRSSFSNMFNYTTAARPVTRSRTNLTSSILGQNRNLDYNYSRNRGTRSVNRNQGVFYNL